MRIALLTPGAGGMYCGTCLHGNTLASALCKAGQDALLVPAYTPIRTDEENVSLERVVFSGINVFLQQKFSWFGRLPRFVDRMLDRPELLRWLGRRSFSTRPEELGPLTVSMLQGEEGRQGRELEKMLDWLGEEIRPEVVHLATALLAGMARPISRQLNVPVVCTLTGEDVFLERLPEPHYSRARQVLRERCGELATIVALNRYYAGFMADYLDVPRERIQVIPAGLNLFGHASPATAVRRRGTAVTVGFLARICPDKGLLPLVEALALLAEDRGLPPIRVVAAGYLAPADQPYLAKIDQWLAARGLTDRFRYVGQVDRSEKVAFLHSLDVMCLPTVHPEGKGLPVLEAWANRIPVVLPDHGVFSELIADTGGGLLCRPHDARSLADALQRLIQDPGLAEECGRRGQEAVHQRYHAELMARRTVELYERTVNEWRTPGRQR